MLGSDSKPKCLVSGQKCNTTLIHTHRHPHKDLNLICVLISLSVLPAMSILMRKFLNARNLFSITISIRFQFYFHQTGETFHFQGDSECQVQKKNISIVTHVSLAMKCQCSSAQLSNCQCRNTAKMPCLNHQDRFVSSR